MRTRPDRENLLPRRRPMGPTSRLRLAALAAAVLLPACSQHTTEPSMRVATSNAQAQAVPLAGTLAEKEVGLVDLTIGRVTRVEGEERLRQIPTGGTPGDWQVTPIGFLRTVRGDVTPVVTGPSYRAEDEVALDNPAEVILTDLWRQDRSGLFAFQPDLAVSHFRPLARRMASGVDAAHAAAIDRAVALLEAKRAAVLGAASGEMPVRR